MKFWGPFGSVIPPLRVGQKPVMKSTPVKRSSKLRETSDDTDAKQTNGRNGHLSILCSRYPGDQIQTDFSAGAGPARYFRARLNCQHLGNKYIHAPHDVPDCVPPKLSPPKNGAAVRPPRPPKARASPRSLTKETHAHLRPPSRRKWAYTATPLLAYWTVLRAGLHLPEPTVPHGYGAANLLLDHAAKHGCPAQIRPLPQVRTAAIPEAAPLRLGPHLFCPAVNTSCVNPLRAPYLNARFRLDMAPSSPNEIHMGPHPRNLTAVYKHHTSLKHHLLGPRRQAANEKSSSVPARTKSRRIFLRL